MSAGRTVAPTCRADPSSESAKDWFEGIDSARVALCQALAVNRYEDHEPRGNFAPLVELAEAFAALVQVLHDGDTATMDARQILRHAAAAMPAAKHADLSIVQDGHTRSIATTSDLPAKVHEIRLTTGQGPSLDVLDTNDLVLTNDIAGDPRWPEFAAQLVDCTQIRSIASYRLYLGRSHKAALTFYSEWPHAYDDTAIATGAIYAAYCSLALLTDVVLAESLSPARAADVHREIGVAIAILMTYDDLTADAAYQNLHTASRKLHRTLPDIARTVVATHVLPDDDPANAEHRS